MHFPMMQGASWENHGWAPYTHIHIYTQCIMGKPRVGPLYIYIHTCIMGKPRVGSLYIYTQCIMGRFWVGPLYKSLHTASCHSTILFRRPSGGPLTQGSLTAKPSLIVCGQCVPYLSQIIGPPPPPLWPSGCPPERSFR